MKRLLLLLSILSSIVYAQTPKELGLQSINKQSAEAYISFLASDALQGRKAGSSTGAIAAEYIKSQLIEIGIKPLFDSYSQSFYAFRKNTEKRFFVIPDSVTPVLSEQDGSKIQLQNILGVIEGKNKSECVVVGAHYDHLGVGISINGDSIYNGADDNASGVSAVLQIAKAIKESGQQPQRTIIFAFWDGEELGLLGSEFFMLNCPTSTTIKAYLNFDMIGRNKDEAKPEQVVYFYTATNHLFGDWLKNDIATYNLNLKPDYKPWDSPTAGSDNASFAKRSIPIIWYHTDGHADYHKPSDHVIKINWGKLVDITKAAYLNVWNLVNCPNY